MKILLIEPYYTGSHAAWAEGYQRHSHHEIEILSLPGRFWKWRMHGGAVTLARQFLTSKFKPDLILATDMLDLTTFLALTRPQTATIPTAIYFHENQLTYPWSPTDRDVAQQRDKHYGFINYSSALAGDLLLFNSAYHQDSFLAALPRLLNHFPDYQELDSVAQIQTKSKVLPLGLELRRFDAYQQPRSGQPLLIWNHRWEHDKNPVDFFRALTLLSEEGLEFGLIVLGENFSRKPEPFLVAQQRLKKHIVQFGYVETFADYATWLWRADIVPVTSIQDFFGASIVEAMYCNGYPLLPKRLAYPHIVPAEYHALCFYDNFDDLVKRLREAMLNIDETRQTTLQHVAAQYDWQPLADDYDTLLANQVDDAPSNPKLFGR